MTDENTEITATADGYAAVLNNIIREEDSKKAYDGPPAQRRKRNRKKVKPSLGVGGLLDYARIKFRTEKGDYDIEEEDDGTILIGGEELTFESWGELNRVKQDGVHRAEIVLPKQKIRKPKLIYDIATTSNGNSKSKKEKEKEKIVKQTKKVDKDEGELSDSEISDSSISSSDSDGTTRKTVKKRKSAKQGMEAMEIFTKAYQYRSLLVQNLNLQQKMVFFELLRSTT